MTGVAGGLTGRAGHLIGEVWYVAQSNPLFLQIWKIPYFRQFELSHWELGLFGVFSHQNVMIMPLPWYRTYGVFTHDLWRKKWPLVPLIPSRVAFGHLWCYLEGLVVIFTSRIMCKTPCVRIMVGALAHGCATRKKILTATTQTGRF